MALSISWLLERANRKLNASGLSPEVARRTREVIREMHTQGIYVGVAQGYRSIAEQNRLYAQGRTTPGSIVTNARGDNPIIIVELPSISFNIQGWYTSTVSK